MVVVLETIYIYTYIYIHIYIYIHVHAYIIYLKVLTVGFAILFMDSHLRNAFAVPRFDQPIMPCHSSIFRKLSGIMLKI